MKAVAWAACGLVVVIVIVRRVQSALPSDRTRAIEAASRSNDPEVRRTPIRGVSGLGAVLADDSLRVQLLRSLDDPSASVREEACRALGPGGGGDGNAVVSGLQALGRIGDRWTTLSTEEREIADALARRLLDPAVRVRHRAAESLARYPKGLSPSTLRGGLNGQPPRDPVPLLATALTHPSRSVRLQAAKDVVEPGPERSEVVVADAAAVLTAALEDDDEDVRQRATRALALIGPDARAAVPALLLAQSRLHPDKSLHTATWNAIFAIDVPARRTLDALEPLATAEPGQSRVQAIREVVNDHGADPRAARILTLALGDSAPSVRALAASGLSAREAGPARAALLAALEDTDPGVRVVVADRLGAAAAEPGVAQVLRRALDDPAEDVRVAAASALARRSGPDPAISSVLVRALNEGESRLLRAKAAVGLLPIARHPDATAALLRSAEDEDPLVGRTSIAVLCASDADPSVVVPAVVRALLDGTNEVCAAAFRGAATLGRRHPRLLTDALAEVIDPPPPRTDRGPPFRVDGHSFAGLTKVDRRALACRLLASLGADAAAASPALLRVVNSGNELSTPAACAYAAVCEDRSQAATVAVAHVAKRVSSDRWGALDPHESLLLDLLAGLPGGPERVLAVLVPEASAKGSPRRWSYIASIGRLGPAAEGAVPCLVDALGDPDQNVRNAAVRAIGAIGPAARSAVPAILALDSPDGPVANWATLQTLARIGAGAPEVLRRLDAAKAAPNTGEQELLEIAKYIVSRTPRPAIDVLVGTMRTERAGSSSLRWAGGVWRTPQRRDVDLQPRDLLAPGSVNELLDAETAWLVGRWGSPRPEILARLGETLGGGDEIARLAAAAALARIGGDATPTLAARAAHPDEDVRVLALTAIAAIGANAASAAPAVQAAISSSAPGSRTRAAAEDAAGALRLRGR